ncbi:alpha/beta hydrolase [Alteraurantiacibacter aquimixticola]|uniref:Alpha/beta hydrolase n=1 Tax=Alteraurantiacibacter aquimixticola TaxID=2489173 RepID=A0A4T3EWA8_9SPHN|nr:alpha/beta hydrolase [Alteraurantiacibacter aquimixticola]TIX48826.1 alpha/beta hydrolase [Alteraurantiacibacter aquimixticola]
MANYVLVHGAWGGNHTYGEVPARLEAAGHKVLNCTLPGLGSRQEELHRGITLTDHIDAVCEQVEEAGFDRFILAGHSYGGMVITGVSGRLGKRIDGICYIDAFWPEDGEALWHITGKFEHEWYLESQKYNPGFVRPLMSPPEFAPVPGVVGYHPLLTLVEAVQLSGDEQGIAKKSYIFATGYEGTPFPRFAEKAKAAGWDYHETDTDHFVMEKDPELTVEVLLGLAG